MSALFKRIYIEKKKGRFHVKHKFMILWFYVWFSFIYNFHISYVRLEVDLN